MFWFELGIGIRNLIIVEKKNLLVVGLLDLMKIYVNVLSWIILDLVFFIEILFILFLKNRLVDNLVC